MKKILYISLSLVIAAIGFISCSKDQTYAEQKDKERSAVEAFLTRDVTIVGPAGDTVCNVGVINVITEQEFYDQDSTTNLERNEYVLFSSSGIYMQIVRPGVGEKIAKGETRQVACRFIEFNILGDSLQLRNDVSYWHTNPDIIAVTNTSGTFSASFVTGSQAGAMYQTYGEEKVLDGWLAPFPYIRIGRQMSEDGEIAKVRLIVPHTAGQSSAATNVYPCFYEILYQECRD
ncbi:MAG: DUF4827 domain-containing protein [Bacteroidaceae bacterium]|nr:DUF4827 domain-containing protein [Bacteroidaceae bacterium]